MAFERDLFSDIIADNCKVQPLDSIWDITNFQKKSGIEDLSYYNFKGFSPWEHQAGIFQDIENRSEFVRHAHLVQPRRSGKTIWAIIYLIIKSLEKASASKFPFYQYGLLYPDLTQGKEVAWNDLEHYTEGLPGRKTLKNSGRVEFYIRNQHRMMVKIIIKIVGLKNYDSRRGGFFDGIILDERKDIPRGFEPIINPDDFG